MPQCRTFKSKAVEQVIEDMKERLIDPDLARLFENAFPNTLDTTIRWHVEDGSTAYAETSEQKPLGTDAWKGPQSFVVTGDINAEWLRDSAGQLASYQALAAKDKKLKTLILGAINTQAEFVIQSPYCNAFQPPAPSRLSGSYNGQQDDVHPLYEPSVVFECKYELDSLANFLSLANDFHANTGSKAFLTPRFYAALSTLLKVLTAQSMPSFDPDSGHFQGNEYTFRRNTNTGTETLSLAGLGNPMNAATGLIRSAFRPSDDATIFPILIPANALMCTELRRMAAILDEAGKSESAKNFRARSDIMEEAIWEHGTAVHPVFGDVFAYEIDGYGSRVIMDDANLPSLLALPLHGFVNATDRVYLNTRKMLLQQRGNPYYLEGKSISGVGGPHIGLQYVWPMSLLVQAMTSQNDTEIMEMLNLVVNSSRLGLVHESIYVNRVTAYTSKSSIAFHVAVMGYPLTRG
ncbi:MAG: hypothetical protein M1814_000705 [Vezdaea aestivalis]|nr:MAG: hypothetical protein M1814_000705 [Vezdaea aestivalis]